MAWCLIESSWRRADENEGLNRQVWSGHPSKLIMGVCEGRSARLVGCGTSFHGGSFQQKPCQPIWQYNVMNVSPDGEVVTGGNATVLAIWMPRSILDDLLTIHAVISIIAQGCLGRPATRRRSCLALWGSVCSLMSRAPLVGRLFEIRWCIIWFSEMSTHKGKWLSSSGNPIRRVLRAMTGGMVCLSALYNLHQMGLIIQIHPKWESIIPWWLTMGHWDICRTLTSWVGLPGRNRS